MSTISSQLQTLYTEALKNDNKIDTTEFEGIKKEILADKKLDDVEKNFLIDKMSLGQFDRGAIPQVASLIANPPGAEVKGAEAKPEEAKPTPPEEPKAEEKKSPWSKEFAIQGHANRTIVTDGWNGQYGNEVSATKIEGSVNVKVNYDGEKMAWRNTLLLEYGNAFVEGEDRAVTKNNLEFTTEVGKKLYEKGDAKEGKVSVEIPYLALYTKGPITEIDGRKFRESTGARVAYEKEGLGKYSLKAGVGVQHQHNIETKAWDHTPGIELVAEATQEFSFLEKPLGMDPEDDSFLDRLEGNASVNAFNQVRGGVSISNTDVTIRTGLKYYITDKKNVWVGATKQWQYGGQEESTWESRTSFDLGFKFD